MNHDLFRFYVSFKSLYWFLAFLSPCISARNHPLRYPTAIRKSFYVFSETKKERCPLTNPYMWTEMLNGILYNKGTFEVLILYCTYMLYYI